MGVSTKYQSYYTKSEPILDYMTQILDIKSTDAIFEPCGGNGAFVDKILKQIPSANISIFELDPNAVATLQDKYACLNNISIKSTDTLLDNCIVNRLITFDKIIGNPPYGARNDDNKKNELAKLYPGLYTKESYTLFLFACIKCLNEGGMLSFIVPDTFLSLHRHLAIRQFILQHTQIKELSLFPSSYFPGVDFGYANLCIITLQKSSNIASNLSNKFTIRTGFTSVNDLYFPHKGTHQEFTQSDILNNPASAFFFNSNSRINSLVNDITIRTIGDIADCVTGFYSGNDKIYLRPANPKIKNAKKYQPIFSHEIHHGELTEKEKKYGIKGVAHYVPIVKGGNKQYIKPDEWYMDWSENAICEYRTNKKCRFQNASFYFKNNGIAIPMVRSRQLTAALINERLFDQSIVGVFPRQEILTMYLLAFFNSSVCTKLINTINPSTNNSANYIKRIPFIPPTDEILNEVTDLTQEIIHRISNGDLNIESLKKHLDSIFVNLYEI